MAGVALESGGYSAKSFLPSGPLHICVLGALLMILLWRSLTLRSSSSSKVQLMSGPIPSCVAIQPELKLFSEDMGSVFEEELGYSSYVQLCLIQIMTDAGKPDRKGIYTCGMTDLNSCCKPDFKTPTSTVEKSIYNRSCSTVPSIGH
ncbi:hypothetical protein H4Q26_009797 [Puccinia striiformis f. sp. tritici PST-130]|nr:hypothetical protein H4Q26_009797 [Puccinia striiformis f. sp. tritici PST-130]